MKQILQKMKQYVLVVLLVLMGNYGWGQTTVFSENIGTSTAGTTSIALTTFQNSSTLTFTGDADTRANTSSTG